MSETNRISIRINGKEPAEKKMAEETAAANEESRTFNWVLPEETSSPDIEDTTKHRKAFGKGGASVAKGQAPRLPLHRKKKTSFRKLKGTKKKWIVPKSQYLSGFCAVITGVILGLIVLTIFTNPHHLKHSLQVNQSEKASALSSGTKGGIAAAKNLDLNLQVIQGGAFSTVANGQVAKQKLQGEGLAAVLTQQGKEVYLYIGIGDDSSAAESISSVYKQKGQAVWVKPFSVHVNSSQLDKETKRFLSEAKPVILHLIKGSSNGLSGNEAFTDEEWASIQNQMKQLKQDETSQTKSLMAHLKQAETAIASYQANPKTSALWKAQQSLLSSVTNYKQVAKGN